MMNHDGLVCLIGVKEAHVILVQAKNTHHQGWLLLPCQDVVRMSIGSGEFGVLIAWFLCIHFLEAQGNTVRLH